MNFKLLVLCALFSITRALQILEKEDKLNGSQKGLCDEFFHGTPWPEPYDTKGRGLVKLCQNQIHGGDVEGKFTFATIFSTKERIPVYTANAIVLHRDGKEYPRPSSEFWDRVSLALCSFDGYQTSPVASRIGHAPHSEMEKCRKFQATSEDYSHNGLNLDRGHLSPNSINEQDREKQIGTFTLTNAAPQFADFNRESWRVYECVAQHTILDFVPGQTVFIVTGTHGVALDPNNNPWWMNGHDNDFHKNPVKIPGVYWKAVCYPGNATHSPWGYAIIQKNENVRTTPDFNEYITLKEFNERHIITPPFGPSCMDANFGVFASVFKTWKDYIDTKCPPYTNKKRKKGEL